MSGPVSAPTPSPERPGGDRLEVPRHAACGSIIAHGPHLGCDGLTYPSYDGGWLTDAEADRDLPAPDPRSPEDGAVERGERSEHERWFVIHVNQISALRFAEFPVERLARASVAACNCGPHQIRKTTTVTYTDHGELELVPATPANRATR